MNMVAPNLIMTFMSTYPGISGSDAIPGTYTNAAAISVEYGGHVSGTGTLFPNIRHASTTDGASNTILVGEQSDMMRAANGSMVPMPTGAVMLRAAAPITTFLHERRLGRLVRRQPRRRQQHPADSDRRRRSRGPQLHHHQIHGQSDRLARQPARRHHRFPHRHRRK